MKVSEMFLRAAQYVDSGASKYPRVAIMLACDYDVNKYNETIPVTLDVFPFHTSGCAFDTVYEDKQAIVLGLLLCAELAKEDE